MGSSFVGDDPPRRSRVSPFCSLAIARSLPGIVREENSATSPRSSTICGCSSAAMRASAERGSPWLPVQTSTILSRGTKPASYSLRKGGASAR